MAGIFGVLRVDGALASQGELAAIQKAMEVIPAVDRPTWICGSAGIGACNTGSPDSRTGILPLVTDQGDTKLAIVADARIDNRKDLAGKLGIGQSRLAGLSDSQLILLSYQKWGEHCPAQLLGDFVFVIWDGQTQTCLLVRDHLGVKPLFLYQDSNYIVFATDIAGVLGHPRVSAILSDEAVAQFLGQGELYSDRQTFYRDIQKLPPATCLRIGPAKRAERVYWEPAAVPRLEYPTTEDYVLRLRELFESAVTVRLPGSGPVGTHLSGGLDSSAIAFQAARRGAELKAWSWMRSPGSASERANPEWSRAALVADRLGIELNWTDIEAEQMPGFLGTDILSSGDSTNLYYEYWVRPAARAEGIHVMLSGWGGDQFISNQGRYRYFETFWKGAPLAALADMWRHARMSRLPFKRFAGLFLRRILRPLIPGRGLLVPEYSFLKFAQPGLAESWVSQKAVKEPALSDIRIRSQQLDEFHFGHLRNRLEGWAAAGSRAGIEYRYPLLDKRIVEFALGLPAEMYLQQGYSRYIFRAAMSGVLPAEICWENAKLEPVRVREGLAAGARSLTTWKSSNPDLKSEYINVDALNAWIDGVSPGNKQGSARYQADIVSAFLAKLVLNLETRVC